MLVGLFSWLAIVIPVTLALAVRRRLYAARWLVGVGAIASLVAALWIGSWNDRRERLRRAFDDGTRWAGLDTAEGAHIHVDVFEDDAALAIPGGLGAAPAGHIHRLWFLDERGAPLVAMDLTDASRFAAAVLRDRPELARAASVLLVAEPAGTPRPTGKELVGAPLRRGGVDWRRGRAPPGQRLVTPRRRSTAL